MRSGHTGQAFRLPALIATLALLAFAAPAAHGATFSSTGPIAIHDSVTECGVLKPATPASPYPSTIAVAGLSGPVVDVDVAISLLSHNWPADVGILLVGPTGATTVLMTDSGSRFPVAALDLTFDQAAATPLPSATQLGTGTYLPTRGTASGGDGCSAPSAFPAPAPSNPYGSTLDVFNAANPNGDWSLYVIDDAGGSVGAIGSWSIDIENKPMTLTGRAAYDRYLDWAFETGTITFTAYGPDDRDCSGPPAFTDTVAVSGNGDYQSGHFVPTQLGA